MGEQQRRDQQAGADDVVRGRPGRRPLEDRQAHVLELLGGKATVDQAARRYGVKSETIEARSDEDMAGISEALRRGPGKSSKELELERENKVLKDALTRQVMKTELLERALEARPPTLPGKSRR